MQVIKEEVDEQFLIFDENLYFPKNLIFFILLNQIIQMNYIKSFMDKLTMIKCNSGEHILFISEE